MKNICIDGKPVKKAYIDGKLWYQKQSGYGGLCITSLEDGNAISIVKNGSAPACTFEYSTDGSNWNSYTIGNTITIDKDEKVYFRSGASGNSALGSTNTAYHNFNSTKTFNASGNLYSLLSQDFENFTSFKKLRALQGIFMNSKIVDASEIQLPMLYLNQGQCYMNMFRGCSSLTTAPELPATTIASNCYFSMFRDCHSLTKAPELPATTLFASCYNNMFYNCNSLTQAPELPATSIDYPTCYSSLFYGCTSLQRVKVHFGNFYNYASATGSTFSWMKNTPATGTFICPEALVIPERGTNTVPAGWTIERF